MRTFKEAAERMRALVREVGKHVVGKTPVLRQVVIAIAANGNVILEDYPGVAKTLTVKRFSEALGLAFNRVQFTPDLLPADVTGSVYFNLEHNRFELRKGPIFTNVLLADEINRAPPKTQSALLEAMQEQQTTLEGETHRLPQPFLVFATQNPLDIEGTYPLPEAQLDRFMVRLSVGYPTREAEVEVLERREAAKRDEVPATRVFAEGELATLQHVAEQVRCDQANKDYIVRLVQATREDERVALGASPRGSLALYKLAKAHAVYHGRGYVIPDDVKAVAVPGLAHRLILTGDARVRGVKPEEVIQEFLASVPTPAPPRADGAPAAAAETRG